MLTVRPVERPIPKFNIGDRVVPMTPCLLIAGEVTECKWETSRCSSSCWRYKIRLDIPMRGKLGRYVERNESELQYCSVDRENLPYLEKL